MSDRLGFFIGECGHLRPISANNRRIGACKCERPPINSVTVTESGPATASPHRPDYFEQLAAAVEELGRSRYLLGQVIALAGESPGLTDEQLRDRLTALADRTQHRDPPDPRPAAG